MPYSNDSSKDEIAINPNKTEVYSCHKTKQSYRFHSFLGLAYFFDYSQSLINHPSY